MSNTYKEAVTAINCIEIDINMLRDGSWEPDDDSCDATLEMIEKVATFLDSIKDQYEQ